MAGNPKKKSTGIVNAAIGALAVVLAILIVWMMNLVSGIQGTARIINYAGLVRGKTQRIVKLEISGQPQDGMITDIDAFIDGLRFGSDELSLVRLNDDAFQSKMQELDDYFQALKQEIGRVRAVGSNNTDIIPISETFFGICDDATGLAEAYSQRKATSLSALEKYITADIVVLMLLIGYQLFQALHTAAMNRALQHKVYLDAATGLPNKNKCEELLDDPTPPAPETGVCSFDLNNLRRINNSMGHEAGDAYIRRFAVALRAAMPEEHFVGRTGGDEFLAITHGPDADALQKLLAHVRKQLAEESRQHPDTPLIILQRTFCTILKPFTGDIQPQDLLPVPLTNNKFHTFLLDFQPVELYQQYIFQLPKLFVCQIFLHRRYHSINYFLYHSPFTSCSHCRTGSRQ